VSSAVGREPCPKCRAEGGDGTGNNLALFSDGHGYCFASHGYFSKELLTDYYPQDILRVRDTSSILKEYSLSNQETIKEITKDNYTYEYLSYRGISKDTYSFYDVHTKVLEGRPISHGYVYPNGAIKVRTLPKSFSWSGPASEAGLFGADKFQQGSARSITLCEGELDALSVYQMLGSKYPALSVRGSSSARSDCQRAWEYLNSFERIYLCFDNDEPGSKATAEVASLFNPNKIYHVKLTKHKDANEYLVNGHGDEFLRAWHNAKPYLPKGIIGDYKSIHEALKKEDAQATATYPFPTLDGMAYGIRSSELVLLTAQEKVGKTEVLRAIEAHILKTTDHNIGIIHLEEKEKRSVQGLASYDLGVPCHLPDSGVSTDDVLEAYKRLSKRDGRVFFYTHFGADDPDVILDRIRYLVTVCGCKFIFLDHMTMLVSGEIDNRKRETLDMLATRFAMMTRELDFTLFLICHVNDEGQPRDSRMIAKTCDLQIYLERDKISADPAVRNTVRLTCRDNRYGSITGPAGVLSFDPKTFRLTELLKPKEELEFDTSV
jgi:twinkle protein